MDPKELHNQRDGVQLVDVREPEEWSAGRIPGARWIRIWTS
jgi:rhodanese-related sulfurtransferase